MTEQINFAAEGIKQAPWPLYSIEQSIKDYAREHAQPNGVNLGPVGNSAWHAFQVWDPTKEAGSLTRADMRALHDYRIATGVMPATVKRGHTFITAALRHAKTEERIKADPPKFPKIPQQQPRLRYLTREEYRTLIQAPMSRRMKLFFLIAFSVGARSRAIEQLEWTRVDWQRRTMDFRLPGINHKNKRRVVAPISDALLPRLQAAYDRPDRTTHVIGLGERGHCTSTYYESRKVFASIGITERGVARHVARHSVASWLLQGDPERGILPTPIDKVAKLLGDKISMIEAVYGHLQPGHLITPI